MNNHIELRKFLAPEIISGTDSRLIVGRYLDYFESRKPFIVTDKNVSTYRWFEEILEEIDDYVDDYIIYDQVTPNPTDLQVFEGNEIFLSSRCDLIIAIGGGSPIDCAKGIAILSANPGEITDYVGVDQIENPGPPLICIPSTAGSSADISQFAIILDREEKLKKAIISKKIVPDLALLDPVPLTTMDPYLRSCTGIDALTHAIEAYVSNASSPLTDTHAIDAIHRIYESLEKTSVPDFDPLQNSEVMANLMFGSLEAGLAFSNASLGAVHAMAHSLGGLLNLPHGECNALLLEHVVEYNYDSEPEKFRIIAKTLNLPVESLNSEEIKEELCATLKSLRISLGIVPHLRKSDLSEDIIHLLVKHSLDDPCIITNPKHITEEDVMKIYGQIIYET